MDHLRFHPLVVCGRLPPCLAHACSMRVLASAALLGCPPGASAPYITVVNGTGCTLSGAAVLPSRHCAVSCVHAMCISTRDVRIHRAATMCSARGWGGDARRAAASHPVSCSLVAAPSSDLDHVSSHVLHPLSECACVGRLTGARLSTNAKRSSKPGTAPVSGHPTEPGTMYP